MMAKIKVKLLTTGEEWKIIKPKEYGGRYKVKNRNPVTKRWDLMITHSDLKFVKEWLKAEGVKKWRI